MSTVVAIHNAVNERAWQHVLAWERLHACACDAPKLLRFKGRPSEFSPKARLLNFLVRRRPGPLRLAPLRPACHTATAAAMTAAHREAALLTLQTPDPCTTSSDGPP
jgi:hypothetical protein